MRKLEVPKPNTSVLSEEEVVSRKDVLALLASDGIISAADAESIVIDCMMKKKEAYVAKHSRYKVWHDKKDGRYKVWIPYEGHPDRRNRRQVSRSTEEELIDFLYDFYKYREETLGKTVRDIYNAWIDHKLKGKMKRSTKDRYDAHFKKLFGPIEHRGIGTISEAELLNYVEDRVCDLDMLRTEFRGCKTIMKGIFLYAKRRGYVKYNINYVMDELDIADTAFRTKVPDPKENVFDETEHKAILEFLSTCEHTPKMMCLLLMAVTGCRPGEAARAMHHDFDGRVFHIQRTNRRYKADNGKYVYEATELPKTPAGDRYAVIHKNFAWIADVIRDMNPESDYVFLNKNGEPFSSNVLNNEVKRICKKLGIRPRKEYCFRTTYATILLDNRDKISISTSNSQLGHTCEKTTLKFYYKDRKNLETKMAEIDSLLEF